ncbi:MAG: formate dehydrogenase accessory sulfurtransferase FdhD [Planctomycetes bacterium]|nr:formate dehydrogenase accessory sulfurtransferase FdhD [Planctomycetota bacterium]
MNESTSSPDGSQPRAAAVNISKHQFRAGEVEQISDWVAVEEPLEIRIQGEPYAVLLRTPGDEQALIAGFLASEGIIAGLEDLAAVSPCPNGEAKQAELNYWNVALADGVRFDQSRRKSSTVGSTCGLCGVRAIEEIQGALPKANIQVETLTSDFFGKVEQQVREQQKIWHKTAGVHAAALACPATADLIAIAEDVGRHNAVDKVLGSQMLADAYPVERAAVLWVSGRLSFELVQKAALAGVAVVVGLGTPTSLAVEAARISGLSLFGLAREKSVNRYCGVTDWTAI